MDKASKDKGKWIRFDGIQVPLHKKPDAQAAMVSEEILLPEIQQSKNILSSLSTSQSTPAPVSAQPKSHNNISASSSSSVGSFGSTSTIPPHIPQANLPPSFVPISQYKYSFPLEDKSMPACILSQVLDSSVPVPVKDLFMVLPEFQKQFWDLTMVKHIMHLSTHLIHVNELASHDPSSVNQEYEDWVLQNNDGLIIAHHNLLLQAIEGRFSSIGCSIMGVLDSRLEIIAMPKYIWKELRLPIQSDHMMKMSSTNTSVDSTIGILKNLAIDFGAREVML